MPQWRGHEYSCVRARVYIKGGIHTLSYAWACAIKAKGFRCCQSVGRPKQGSRYSSSVRHVHSSSSSTQYHMEDRKKGDSSTPLHFARMLRTISTHRVQYRCQGWQGLELRPPQPRRCLYSFAIWKSAFAAEYPETCRRGPDAREVAHVISSGNFLFKTVHNAAAAAAAEQQQQHLRIKQGEPKSCNNCTYVVKHE